MTKQENTDRELTGAAILQNEMEEAFALIDQVKDSLAKLELPDQSGANGKALEETRRVVAVLQRQVEAQQAVMAKCEAQRIQIIEALDTLGVIAHNVVEFMEYFASTIQGANPESPELKTMGGSGLDKGGT